METSENFREKTPDLENKWLYLAIPALAIAFAEILMYLEGKSNPWKCMQ